MNSIYIGIDGGGSKTKLRMVDEKGLVLAESIAGPANIQTSLEMAYESIIDAFNSCLEQAQISSSQLKKYSFFAGIGLAGCEVKTAREEFLKKNLPFTFVTLQSDAYIACMGAHAGKNGSVVIAGTGVVGLKLMNGVKTQVGGWGFPHGDEGGGAWLGLEAVKNLLHMVDKQIGPSLLLNELKKNIGGTKENITHWACHATATQYAELAPLIVKHAKKKEPLSLALLKQAAEHIENLLTVFLEQDRPHLPCCLMGGMSSILIDFMKKGTQKKLSKPAYDPCQGAIFMVKRSLKQNAMK